MLFLASILAAAVLTNGTPVPNTRAACTTVASGLFSANYYDGPNKPTTKLPLGVNTNMELTYGTFDPTFKVNFQSCPDITPPETGYIGRITVPKYGANMCLTVEGPNGSPPYFVKIAASDPSPAQTWDLGTDNPGEIFWVGTAASGSDVGYVTADDAGTPKVGPQSRIRLSEADGVGYKAFVLKG